MASQPLVSLVSEGDTLGVGRLTSNNEFHSENLELRKAMMLGNLFQTYPPKWWCKMVIYHGTIR